MADSRTLDVILRGKDQLSGVLAGTGKALAATTAVVAGLASALSAISVKEAVAFDKAMRNVDSIAKLSNTAFGDVSKQVIELSKTLPQSAEVMAKGLYDVYSSGFDGATALEILQQAATGASAGMTDTATSAKGLMAVMNAYGQKTGPDAAKIMDVLFQTVNRGVITFEELSGQIGDVTAIAPIVGVSIEEVGAAFAVMTKHGINGAETATAIASLLRSVLKPSDSARSAAEALGLEWNVAALKAKGFTQFMQEFIDKTAGNEEAMATITGDARAIRAAFILSSEAGREFNRELGYMRDASGAASGALERQAQGTAFQFGLLKNNLNALGIELGTATLPHINALIQRLQGLVHDHGPAVVQFLITLRETLYMPFREVIALVVDLASRYGPMLLSFLGRLADKFTFVFRALTGQMGEVQASTSSVYRAFRTVFDTARAILWTFAQDFKRFWFMLQYEAQKFWVQYGDSITSFAGKLAQFAAQVGGQLLALWNAVKGPLGELGRQLLGLVGAIGELAGPIVSLAMGAIQSFVTVALEGLRVVLPPVISFLGTLVGWLKDAISWLAKFLSPLKTAIAKVTELTSSNLEGSTLTEKAVVQGIRGGVIGRAQFASMVGAGTISTQTRDGVIDLLTKGLIKFKFASGGIVPGTGNTDSVPALLTPGERVLTRSQARAYERGNGNIFNLGVTVYGSDPKTAQQIGDLIIQKLRPALAFAR